MAPSSPAGPVEQHSSVLPVPDEIVLEIAQHLSQKELSALSQASRRLRGLAQQAGLYVRKTVVWNDGTGFRDASLETLEQMIGYATRVNPNINLAIDAIFQVDTPGDETASAFAQAVGVIFNLVQRALPYLASLQLTLPWSLPDDVYTPLCTHPAPRLRSLVIHQWLAPSVPIPQNLFTGEAPVLSRLSLALNDIDPASIWQPVPAFRDVTQLSFAPHGTNHHVRLSQLFPRLKDVKISPLIPPTSTSHKIDISGLTLHSLTLNRAPDLLTDARALKDIPVVALARALGLRGVRPALVLAGFAFDPQPDARALSRAFYAVDVVDRARDVLPPSSFSAAFDPFSNPWDSIRY
ncbi:hypothetical protein AURDEDRAFT_155059 [Auricularia subglabra TFB-10046 SS5]|uniref:F-box domain-containing protein n=1 Tax=Auricularia subglabra (strain TFB-10046 / SS5) TaxID=717982 RepID=J0CVG3_AURST|nr:hypothetical protein AURDEDRAFT_155059 [Auricularia subglabra TFB-10046 SS5]